MAQNFPKTSLHQIPPPLDACSLAGNALPSAPSRPDSGVGDTKSQTGLNLNEDDDFLRGVKPACRRKVQARFWVKRVLSTPQGTTSASRWHERPETVRFRPSPQTLIPFPHYLVTEICCALWDAYAAGDDSVPIRLSSLPEAFAIKTELSWPMANRCLCGSCNSILWTTIPESR
jgi:hypothetical protein